MTKKTVSPLMLGILLAMVASHPALADEQAQVTEANDKNETTEDAEENPGTYTGTVEYGAGYVSDDSYRFGRFTGLEEEGAYPIGAFDIHFALGRPDYLHLQGRDLALDSRWLSLEYGKQGNYETRLEYKELPNFTMDSAQTPYSGAGSDTLTVAPGASPTALNPLELDTKRKELSGGISYFLRKDVKASLDVSQEKKEGTDWIGGALLASVGGFGQTYAVILPEPIDQTTTKLDANLEYNGAQSQLRLNIHASLFDNDNERLRWDDPGFTVGGGGGGGPTLPAQGQLALPPDNQFYQVSLSGATRVTDTTRFTGAVSVGLMEQDEDFLPYGLNSTSALPRSSLDGEVYVYSARAALTSRPLKGLRLKAQYRYDERDNDTPDDVYDYELLDSGRTTIGGGGGGGGATATATNKPLSYEKHKAILDANYRISSKWSASAGYEYHDTERDHSDVENSRENIGRIGLKWRVREDTEASLRLSESSRDASGYETELDSQNPLLRKYNLADRDRSEAGVLVSYSPTSELHLGLSADLTDDDYTDSDIGLTDGESENYNLDISYHPTPDIRLHGFYTYDRLESRQQGVSLISGGDLPNYKVDFDDQVDTFGLGAKFDDVWNGWDLGLTYRYSKGEGDIEHTDFVAGSAGVDYPTLKNELHTVELSAAYNLNKKTRLKLGLIYEELTADDWLVDGVPPQVGGVGGGSTRVLTLGNDSEDYDSYAFMIAVQHHF